jgi:predicted nucleic acid-binding protein
VDTLLERFRIESIEVETTGRLQLCRDPDDDRILETAVTGGARYLVSRDDDLKRDPDPIEHLIRRGVRIVSVARFLELLDAGQA